MTDAPLVLFDFTGLSDRLAPALTLAVADYVEWHVHRLRRARVAGAARRPRPVGGQEPADHRGGLETPLQPGRRSVAERVRAPRTALRAVADVHHPVLPGLRLRTGPRAAVKPRRRAVPGQRAARPRARPRLARADRHRHQRDHLAAEPERQLLDPLHDQQARPRRGPDRPRRPRILDRELQPRARPTATPRRAPGNRRGPLEGAHAPVQPRLARTATPTAGSRRHERHRARAPSKGLPS